MDGGLLIKVQEEKFCVKIDIIKNIRM
jgi:hypothetical protein